MSNSKDLQNLYPDIAKFVVDHIGHSSKDQILGFLFTRKPNVPGGNFFRYRGKLTVDQLVELKRVLKVPSNLTIKPNGGWNEMVSPNGLDFLELSDLIHLDRGMIGIREFKNQLGNDNNYETRTFVNGKEDGDEGYRLFESGDVLVILSEDDDERGRGSLMPFGSVPVIRIYEEELDGPFVYAPIAGLYPDELWEKDPIKRELRLKRDDEVVCPTCVKGDCGNHKLKATDKVFVRRGLYTHRLLYEIESSAFIGSDATDTLLPFAQMVLGRKVREKWPPEIISLTIDGEEHFESTCGESIHEDSEVEIVLSDSRIR